MPIRSTRAGTRTKVIEPLEWAFPPQPLPQREVIERHPAGGPAGDRPPLLFVHGHSHAAWCWDEHWLPALAERGWSGYALSLRGHGASAGSEGLHRWTLRDYEHDVLQTITALPAPPVLVGHSMGGLVVQRVLERYLAAPAAVLVAPTGDRHGFGVVANLVRRRPVRLAQAAAMRPLRLDAHDLFAGLDEAAGASYAARLTPEAPRAQLQLGLPRRAYTAACPVLVLGGGADTLVPASDLVRSARRYGTRAHLFAGMGHDLMLDAGWQAPLALLLDWLEDVLAPAEGRGTL